MDSKNLQTGRGYFNEGFRSAFGNGGLVSLPEDDRAVTQFSVAFRTHHPGQQRTRTEWAIHLGETHQFTTSPLEKIVGISEEMCSNSKGLFAKMFGHLFNPID